MLISPINFASVNFTGKIKYLSGHGATKEERYRDLESELKLACIARRAGVDAPNYRAVPVSEHKDGINVKYEVHGEAANIKTNPITPKHLDNLFTNFYRMEEVGFCHGYLVDRYVLFGENGRVQIDSMKDARRFIDKDGKFIPQNEDMPAFAMPSNADNYEAQSLCSYVEKMDEAEKTSFIKSYLEYKSDYHAARVELLTERDFHPLSKTLKLEKLKSKMFKDPSDDVVEFTKQRFSILNLKKQAAIMWNDGNGLFNGVLDPQKRFLSSIVMLEALKRTIKLQAMAEKLSKESEDKTAKEYFALEKQCLEKMSDNLYKDIFKEADNNFCCPNFGTKGLYLASIEDRQAFCGLYSNIKPNNSNSNANCSAIDNIIEFYAGLIQDWSSDNNGLYRLEYLEAQVPSLT